MALNNGLNDPTTTTGDIIYRDSTGKTTKLPVGTDKEVLKINGTNIEWQPEGDENSVKLTGDQTIAGVKTFTSSPVVPAPTTNFQAATKKYVDDNATSGYVDITTAQSIGGVKTFTSSPVVPAPTTNFQAATKKYVDDNFFEKILTATAGENLVNGNICYLKNDGKYWKADSDTETTCKTNLLIATETITSDAIGNFSDNYNFTTSGLTTGDTYYLKNDGGITNSTNGLSIIVIIGYAKSSTILNFRPTATYLEQEGWNLNNASYVNKNFSISEDSKPTGIFFKSDGTKMYVIGFTSDTIYQYTLSTAWDVSTASYDSVNFSISSQETVPQGLFFNTDGTKMYIIGTASDAVFQYALSSAWDVSTASYNSKNFSISQDTYPNDLFFNTDGTKMYIAGSTNKIVYQYTLSTAWDVTTASYNSKYISITSQDTGLMGLFFKSDGTKMYIVGAAGDKFYQYTLSTAWDVTTATYDSVTISTQDTSPQGMFINSDGTKMYEIGISNNRAYEYSISEKLIKINGIII